LSSSLIKEAPHAAVPPALDVIVGPIYPERLPHLCAGDNAQAASPLERSRIELGAARVIGPTVDTIDAPQQFAYHALRVIN
jgi:hypothetical protein